MYWRLNIFCQVVQIWQQIQFTLLKFNDFSSIQILREINFGDSTSSKSAILHIEGLGILIFQEFLHFLNAEIDQIEHFQTA